MASTSKLYDEIKYKQRQNGGRKGAKTKKTNKILMADYDVRRSVTELQALSLAALIVDYYLEHTPKGKMDDPLKLCDDTRIIEGVILRLGERALKILRQMRDDLEPAPEYEDLGFWVVSIKNYLDKY